MRFLDNVLSDYIARAPDEMARAKYSAERERSVGLGVMGFHSFLQARELPFEGAMAKSWNLKIFKHVRAQVDQASMMLAKERGPCPDAADMGVMERFSCKMAIAPTASISIITGGTSACIEPIPGNVYTHKTLSGSFSIKNPYLAWELGIKSLYYLRSKALQRAGFAGGVEADNTTELKEIPLASSTDYDECLACQ